MKRKSLLLVLITTMFLFAVSAQETRVDFTKSEKLKQNIDSSEGPGEIGYRNTLAKDPDNDGLYEDVNGDGTLSKSDHRLLFLAKRRGNIDRDQIKYLDFDSQLSPKKLDSSDLLSLIQEITVSGKEGALVTGEDVTGAMSTPAQKLAEGVIFESATRAEGYNIKVVVNGETKVVDPNTEFKVNGQRFQAIQSPYLSSMDSYAFIEYLGPADNSESEGPGKIGSGQNPAKDIDNDKLYEDVNGDGSVSEHDAKIFANNIEEIKQQSSYFDYDHDGDIDRREIFVLKNLAHKDYGYHIGLAEGMSVDVGNSTIELNRLFESGSISLEIDGEEETITPQENIRIGGSTYSVYDVINVPETASIDDFVAFEKVESEENSIEEINIKATPQTVSVGDTLKMKVVDGEGNLISEDVEVTVLKNGKTLERRHQTLDLEEKITKKLMKETDWYNGPGDYRFKASYEAASNQVLTDSETITFKEDDRLEALEISLEPKVVSPGQNVTINVTDGKGEPYQTTEASVKLFVNDTLAYEGKNEVIESDQGPYPGTDEGSWFFQGYGDYKLITKIPTGSTTVRETTKWQVEKASKPDIRVKNLVPATGVSNNHYFTAEVFLTGRETASIKLEAETSSKTIEKKVELEKGRNSVEFKEFSKDLEGDTQVTVRAESNLEEMESNNNKLTETLDFGESSSTSVSVNLHEGWNIISSKPLDNTNAEKEKFNLNDIKDDCELQTFEGHTSWALGGGEWTHPNQVAFNRGVLVKSASSCEAEITKTSTSGNPEEPSKKLEKGWNIVSTKKRRPISEISGTCNFQEFQGAKVWILEDGEWLKHGTDHSLNPTTGAYVKTERECKLGEKQAPPVPTGNFFRSIAEVIG